MKKTALVIGGGVAGMKLALDLADEDFIVTLCEAKPRLGGRTAMLKHHQSGDVVDNGQHLMMGAYRHFLDLIERIGTSDMLTSVPHLHIPMYSHKIGEYSISANKIPGKAGFLRAVLSLPMLTLSEKVAFTRLALKLPFMNASSLSESVADFLLRHKQGENLMNYLWTPLVLSVLNASPSEAPASLLVEVIKRAFLSDEEAMKFIYLNTDFASLYDPLIDILERKGNIVLLNTTIAEIQFSGDKVAGARTKQGDFIYADYVISAVPPQQLAKLLPDEVLYETPLKVSRFYSFNTILSAYLWYDEDVEMPLMLGVVDSPIQWVFNRKKMTGSQKKGSVLAITISDAMAFNDMSKLEIFEVIEEELSMIRKEFKWLKPVHTLLLRDKYATFASSVPIEKMRIKQKTQFSNFYICGDWTDTKLPATIEGAALSAEIVKQDILKELNQKY